MLNYVRVSSTTGNALMMLIYEHATQYSKNSCLLALVRTRTHVLAQDPSILAKGVGCFPDSSQEKCSHEDHTPACQILQFMTLKRVSTVSDYRLDDRGSIPI
jgi:hypothetical protein